MPHACRTLTSAWIETTTSSRRSFSTFVALSRVRGLKRDGLGVDFDAVPVALSRVRGLKLRGVGFFLERIKSHSHECVD